MSAAREHIALRVATFIKGTDDDARFCHDVERLIMERSEGNFLWVDLAYKTVSSHGLPWNTPHFIKELPSRPDLNSLYNKAGT